MCENKWDGWRQNFMKQNIMNWLNHFYFICVHNKLSDKKSSYTHILAVSQNTRVIWYPCNLFCLSSVQLNIYNNTKWKHFMKMQIANFTNSTDKQFTHSHSHSHSHTERQRPKKRTFLSRRMQYVCRIISLIEFSKAIVLVVTLCTNFHVWI